jgi:hypothetical protein
VPLLPLTLVPERLDRLLATVPLQTLLLSCSLASAAAAAVEGRAAQTRWGICSYPSLGPLSPTLSAVVRRRGSRDGGWLPEPRVVLYCLWRGQEVGSVVIPMDREACPAEGGGGGMLGGRWRSADDGGVLCRMLCDAMCACDVTGPRLVVDVVGGGGCGLSVGWVGPSSTMFVECEATGSSTLSCSSRWLNVRVRLLS